VGGGTGREEGIAAGNKQLAEFLLKALREYCSPGDDVSIGVVVF
jgi:hypothetical protein